MYNYREVGVASFYIHYQCFISFIEGNNVNYSLYSEKG